MKFDDRPEPYTPISHPVDGNDNQITENSNRKIIDQKMMEGGIYRLQTLGMITVISSYITTKMTFCINIQTFQFVDELRAENVPNSRKMINEMQFIQKPRPLSTSIRPSQNIYRVDNKVNEDIDPKEEAVLKQVREFLYQNMVSPF